MIPQGYEGYLRRLGVTVSETPSVGELFALQRAHLEQVPHENLGVHIGRAPGIDPELSVRRFAAGEGGVCFHLNGGFGALLKALGYDVTLHCGGVHYTPQGRGANGDHLTLTVRIGEDTWFVDVGLRDGPYEPLPLRVGTYEQGAFTYRLERSVAEPGGWTFHHDERGLFCVMEFRGEAATMADFTDFYAEYVRRRSVTECSSFLTTFTAVRRDAEAVYQLRGRVLLRIDAAGRSEREVGTAEEWFALLGGAFKVDLAGLDAADRAALWARVTRAHENDPAGLGIGLRQGRDGLGRPG